jgi:dCMP deaminase
MTRTRSWWDRFFLGAAEYFSTASKDPSTKVGSVIVAPNKSVIGIGFNGFPQGMPDDEELYLNREEKYPRMVHAEMNALLFANQPLHGCTLYTYPLLICDKCFIPLAQAGVQRFVAPIASIDAVSRWGASLDRTRIYAKDMRRDIMEIHYEDRIPKL